MVETLDKIVYIKHQLWILRHYFTNLKKIFYD